MKSTFRKIVTLLGCVGCGCRYVSTFPAPKGAADRMRETLSSRANRWNIAGSRFSSRSLWINSRVGSVGRWSSPVTTGDRHWYCHCRKRRCLCSSD
mmetsp:Transcript_36723/g.37144  ORF Transcript_36723/g.37144 Transcript_36723/m.37144 type:complete len:96 (+) Transcript_36723:582-869(+)